MLDHAEYERVRLASLEDGGKYLVLIRPGYIEGWNVTTFLKGHPVGSRWTSFRWQAKRWGQRYIREHKQGIYSG